MYELMKHFKSLSIYSLFSVMGYCVMANIGNVNTTVDTQEPRDMSPIKTIKKASIRTQAKTPAKTISLKFTAQQTQHITIEFEDAYLNYNPSVGNEWEVWIEVNGRRYEEGARINVSNYQNISMTLKVVEHDKYPDRVSRTVSLNRNHINKGSFSETIRVREGHGRYAGNVAEWQFDFSIKTDKGV